MDDSVAMNKPLAEQKTGCRVIPQIGVDELRHICSFLDRNDQISLASCNRWLTSNALAFVHEKYWPLMSPGKHWFVGMALDPSNQTLPMALKRNLQLGPRVRLDHDYLNFLYTAVSDVTFTLPFDRVEAFERMLQALCMVGSLMAPQGIVRFAGSPLCLFDGEPDPWVLSGFDGDIIVCVLSMVKNFELSWWAKGLRVYFLNIETCMYCTDDTHRFWDFDTEGCHRCECLANYLNQDILGSIIVFQAMRHNWYSTAGWTIGEDGDGFGFGFDFLCPYLSSAALVDETRYHCSSHLHSLLEMYGARYERPTSGQFCDMTPDSVHLYATLLGVLDTKFLDTSHIEIMEGTGDDTDFHSRLVDVHRSVTDDKIEGIVQFVSGLINDKKVSPETLINLVLGKLFSHMVEACPTNFEQNVPFYRQPGSVDISVKDAISSSKVILCCRLRQMLKEIAARTKNKELYDFVPQYITTQFYPNSTVRDIIGFGSILWRQYREVDCKCSEGAAYTSDTVFSIIAMYGDVRNRSDLDPKLYTIAETLTVHIITAHLGMLFRWANVCARLNNGLGYRTTLEHAHDLILDTLHGSRHRSNGSHVGSFLGHGHDIPKACLFYSRTFERSEHVREFFEDDYRECYDDYRGPNGYTWRDLLIVIFRYLTVTHTNLVKGLKRPIFIWPSMDEHEKYNKVLRSVFDLCEEFLVQERDCFVESFPKIGTHMPTGTDQDGPVKYPEYDISLSRYLILPNVDSDDECSDTNFDGLLL